MRNGFIQVRQRLAGIRRLRSLIGCSLLCIFSATAFGQERTTAGGISDLSDTEVVEKISSQNRTEATEAINQAFKRGARIVPLLLKLRGDRRFYFGERLGRRSGDFKIEPEDKSYVRPDEMQIETIEAAALYLISSMYFDSLEFAHSAFLYDTNLAEQKREVGNGDLLLVRAWESTERWASELEEKGLDTLKLKEKRDPLSGSGVRFYGALQGLSQS